MKRALEQLLVRPGYWGIDTQEAVANVLWPWCWIEKETGTIKWHHTPPEEQADQLLELARAVKYELGLSESGEMHRNRAKELIEVISNVSTSQGKGE